MDDASIKATLDIYSTSGDAGLRILKEIGYQPTFYAIPRATGKMSVALSMFSETTSTGSQLRLMASPINPNISNKYGFTGSASAEVTFDIVPLPPNEQIRQTPGPHHRMVTLAQSSSGHRSASPPQSETATVMLE